MKIEITLDHSEVKTAISAALTSKGYKVPPDASFAIDAQGNVTVEILVFPAPKPFTPQSHPSDPGHPYSLACVATCFGYQDPGDEGKGAWGANTNNTTIVGVSVPIPILMATLGGAEVAHVKGHTVSVISVESGNSAVSVDIVDKGPGADVNGKHGLLADKNGTLHALDLTYGLCEVLGVRYDADSGSYPVTWWIEDEIGHPLEMKGLDAPRKII